MFGRFEKELVENMEKDSTLQSVYRRFQALEHKKILIYGTGKYAERLIEALGDFHIVGVLDRFRFEGKFCDKPILIWDDIEENTVDVIIIATSKANYQEVVNRIQYRCIALNITIYGENGRNLSKKSQLKYIDSFQADYLKKREDDLRKLISRYDAISFDLLDTLVMRKTLEPEDIFDIVEEKIKKRGIIVSEFKKKRRTAELLADGQNIYQIYHNLKEITGISEEESLLILQEEIKCEKACWVPRKVMVNSMREAVEQGKRVSIFSNTYFPLEILEELLKVVGIVGYDRLYISCEYKERNETGIFDIYRKEIGNVTCLHVGTNTIKFIIDLKKYKIDIFEIKSACEMLKLSSLRRILLYAGGYANNITIGIMMAEIFNDPFALCHTSGFIKINAFSSFIKVFIAPVVLLYMQNLLYILKDKNYKTILFSSRDGYLFEKLYDNYFKVNTEIPGIYFITSRKLCLISTIYNESDMEELKKWFFGDSELKVFLSEFLGEKILECENIEKYVCYNKDKIIEKSNEMRENYLKYIRKELKDTDKKYLFCDLISSGTVHDALNKILLEELDGFYLCETNGYKKRNLNIVSIYNEEQWENIIQARDLLEVILTSPSPSVRAMDENGDPVYSLDKRIKSDIEKVLEAQCIIEEYVREYVDLLGTDKMINKEIPEEMLGSFAYVNLGEEIKIFLNQKNIDDMTQACIQIMKI